MGQKFLEHKIMFSSRIMGSKVTEPLQYAVENGYFGVEWYLNNKRLFVNAKRNEEFFHQLDQHPNLQFSFHLPTTDVEIGHARPQFAQASLDYLKMYIDFLEPWYQKQAKPVPTTMHLASSSIPISELDWDTTVRNLADLSAHIKAANGLPCMENLKSGWTIDPKVAKELAESTKSVMTLDTGHARSSPMVRSGEYSLLEYINVFVEHIRFAHFYHYESLDKGAHIPPDNWNQVADVWQLLKEVPGLRGIVFELSSVEELEKTVALIPGRG